MAATWNKVLLRSRRRMRLLIVAFVAAVSFVYWIWSADISVQQSRVISLQQQKLQEVGVLATKLFSQMPEEKLSETLVEITGLEKSKIYFLKVPKKLTMGVISAQISGDAYEAFEINHSTQEMDYFRLISAEEQKGIRIRVPLVKARFLNAASLYSEAFYFLFLTCGCFFAVAFFLQLIFSERKVVEVIKNEGQIERVEVFPDKISNSLLDIFRASREIVSIADKAEKEMKKLYYFQEARLNYLSHFDEYSFSFTEEQLEEWNKIQISFQNQMTEMERVLENYTEIKESTRKMKPALKGISDYFKSNKNISPDKVTQEQATEADTEENADVVNIKDAIA